MTFLEKDFSQRSHWWSLSPIWMLSWEISWDFLMHVFSLSTQAWDFSVLWVLWCLRTWNLAMMCFILSGNSIPEYNCSRSPCRKNFLSPLNSTGFFISYLLFWLTKHKLDFQAFLHKPNVWFCVRAKRVLLRWTLFLNAFCSLHCCRLFGNLWSWECSGRWLSTFLIPRINGMKVLKRWYIVGGLDLYCLPYDPSTKL